MGATGAAGAVYLDNGAALKGMGRDDIPAGRRLVIETPGGGGKGDPRGRDKTLIEEDLRAGFVSAQAAAEIYGFKIGHN